MPNNKDKGILMAKKGRKWLFSKPLKLREESSKSEEERENKRGN